MDKKELRGRYGKLDGMGKSLLLDIMNQYKERFIFADTSFLCEFEPDNDLMERILRIGILTDV